MNNRLRNNLISHDNWKISSVACKGRCNRLYRMSTKLGIFNLIMVPYLVFGEFYEKYLGWGSALVAMAIDSLVSP